MSELEQAVRLWAMARQALNYVRSVYTTFPSLKSSNKTRRLTNEIDRQRVFRHYTAKAAYFLNQRNNLQSTSFQTLIDFAKNSPIRNCGELGLLAYDYIITVLEGKAAVLATTGFGDHQITVLGDDVTCIDTSRSLFMYELGQYKNLIICDPFANIIAKPNRYNLRLFSKMREWDKKDKYVIDGDNWVSPTDSDWLYYNISSTWEVLCSYVHHPARTTPLGGVQNTL